MKIGIVAIGWRMPIERSGHEIACANLLYTLIYIYVHFDVK